jgi:NAD(P)-dependent dehydrogenase (short-subunit alcohol dehydrogenase family)
MDVQIKEKSAFVTAGAYGIGEAIADLLTEEGARVIVADCDEVALREKASRWVGVVPADLATPEGIDRAISAVLAAFGGAPDISASGMPLLLKTFPTSGGQAASPST